MTQSRLVKGELLLSHSEYQSQFNVGENTTVRDCNVWHA